jgi:type III secretion protein T
MNGELPSLERIVVAFLLSTPRLALVFQLLPFIGRASMPVIVHVGVVMSLALMLQPMVLAQLPPEPLALWVVFGLVLKEALIGLLIGFVFVIIFHAVEAAGFFIDNQRGSTMASSIDPLLGGQTSPLGLLMLQAFVVYFFVSGGFLLMLGVVYASYAVMPVATFLPTLPTEAGLFFLAQVDRLVRLAFVFAAPVFAAMFIAEIGVALVSRFAPQLNVFFLAMPIKSGVAMLVLVLYAQTFLHQAGLEAFAFDTLLEQLRARLQ